MEKEIIWRDEYNIGVEAVDKEHRRLFQIIHKLMKLKEDEKNLQWACQEGIKFFKGHALKHFAEEEAYMASIHYPALEQHRKIHKSFQDCTLPILEQELNRIGYTPNTVDHFLGVCAGWLIGHTQTEDQAITGKQASMWEDLLPGADIEKLRQVIVQLVFDMFRLESQMVSDVYSAERFGKGVYYRLIYGSAQDENKMVVLLAFEERLLVNTIGKAMGLQSGKLDNMLLHAARFTSRQFVSRIMQSYPLMEHYQLEEENLLSYEQFQRVFERERPQASLLFNTGGEGYFAYCVIAPQLIEKGVEAPIVGENALDGVEKYLARRREQEAGPGRPKILTVDNSAEYRQGIRALLREDYDVAEAASGLGAIRAVILDRPDLVLMDYELSICDGKQILEMLRADEDFRDLPVIFLTGRRDTASMIQVMPLKPAGYLLKSEKPQELKRKIDAFFEKR